MQCAHSNMPYPYYALKWVDVRKVFGRCYRKRGGLLYMLGVLGIPHTGNLHSGLDDSRNIAKIIAHLIRDGFWVDVNDKLPAKMRYWVRGPGGKEERVVEEGGDGDGEGAEEGAASGDQGVDEVEKGGGVEYVADLEGNV